MTRPDPPLWMFLVAILFMFGARLLLADGPRVLLWSFDTLLVALTTWAGIEAIVRAVRRVRR